MAIEKEILYTTLFEKTLNSKAKVIIHRGGSGSSKSFSIAQVLIWKLLNEHKKVIGIGRKTFPALRMSTYKLFIDLLQEYEIYDPKCHNKEFHTYKHEDNLVQFFSLDEYTKIKSTAFNYIWMEEANEFSWDDYTILSLMLRAPTKGKNQLYISFNPVDGNSWLATKMPMEQDTEEILSTYKDNPLLDKEIVNKIKDLINQDANFHRVYALGEWGRLEHIIYKNWKLVDSVPKFDALAYGLDFGDTAPTSLVCVYLVNGTIYVEQKLHQPKLTNKDLISKLTELPMGDIYADYHEPDRIDEIYRAGFNIYPNKTHDVKFGIDVCKRQTIHITRDSPDIIKEIQGYRYKTDKNSNVLEEPVKFHDHAMDAMRYATMGLMERFGFATAQPSSEYMFAVVKSKGFCS